LVTVTPAGPYNQVKVAVTFFVVVLITKTVSK